MAAGLPVVAPAVDRMPTLVGHERDGLLYEPAAPGALASALERLTDARLRARLGTAARNGPFESTAEASHCRALDAAFRRARRATTSP